MTDKIKVEKLAEMKERENRDLDTLVNENTLVAGETGAGVFGVFKFFQGIRNFFKGIQALGTLVTTSKIPVLQDDGSLKFTTPADITSGLATTTELNNALANLQQSKSFDSRYGTVGYVTLTVQSWNNVCFTVDNAYSMQIFSTSNGDDAKINVIQKARDSISTSWCLNGFVIDKTNKKIYLKFGNYTPFDIITQKTVSISDITTTNPTTENYTMGTNLEYIVNQTILNNALTDLVHTITTTDEAITIVSGGYSQIGKMVVVNFRFKVTTANSLITFETNLPHPPIMVKQYIPANVINIQQDIAELNYGYKLHGNGNVTVRVAQANVEYAYSCVYICQ